MRRLIAGLSLSLLLAPAVSADDALRQRANVVFKPIPQQMTEVNGKSISKTQIELGWKLWFDPRLSRSHLISCNSCHALSLGGADNVPASIGHGWQQGPRNSPTVLNAVFNAAQFWDGRARDLKEQAVGPLQAPVEMNNTPERVEATLRSIPEYVVEFRRAFPDSREPVSFDNAATALAAFETTLITPNAPFDKFLAGDAAALDAEQKRGLALFMDTGCIACHNGVNVGGQAYFPFGVVKRPGAEILPPEDRGRFMVTNTASDEYVFRASPLRNVALTAPYFHSGEVWSLEQAVAVMGDSQFGRTLKDEETRAIAAFLRSLTGDQPQLGLPILPPSTAQTPKPELAWEEGEAAP
jgi:cytochrome c peroxidase